MLRVGIIGCGGFSGAHARRLRALPQVQVAALASRSPGSIQALVDRRLADYEPQPARYTDLDEMFATARPDAVVISTPHHLHFAQAMQAIKAGCHVLVEKPMTTSLQDAVELARAAEAAGVRLAVCYNPPYSPAVAALRSAIGNGRLGELNLVSGYLSQNWKTPTTVTWRHDEAAAGGGQSVNSGAHMIAGLCWTVPSPPAEVFAYRSTLGAPVDVNTVLAIRHRNGLLSSLTIGGHGPADNRYMSYVFPEAHVEVDGWKGEWIRGSGLAADLADRFPPESLGEVDPDRDFVESILASRDPAFDGNDGVLVAAVMEAMKNSAASGRPVPVESVP